MKKKMLFIFTFILTILVTSNAFAFTDTEQHWAKDYINQLVGMGAVKGYDDNTFRPEEAVTRAEFTAILLRALGNDVDQPEKGEWYQNYIAEAKKQGYIKDGDFPDVNRDISRMEIAKMLVRALGREETAQELAGKATSFKDDDTIAEDNKGYVRVCYEYGIIKGTPEGNFLPNKTATRGEAAKMIITFLANRGKEVEIADSQPEQQEPEEGELYLYEYDQEKEVKVETTHPELIPHIKKGMEILNDGNGYLEASYYKGGDQVLLSLYKDKSVIGKDIWEIHPILDYCIYTKWDGYGTYLPYSIHLYDGQNEMCQEKFKQIIKDVFPEAYDMVVKEMENKVKDPSYANKIWKEVNGREIRVFIFEGGSQVDVYIAPEN